MTLTIKDDLLSRVQYEDLFEIITRLDDDLLNKPLNDFCVVIPATNTETYLKCSLLLIPSLLKRTNVSLKSIHLFTDEKLSVKYDFILNYLKERGMKLTIDRLSSQCLDNSFKYMRPLQSDRDKDIILLDADCMIFSTLDFNIITKNIKQNTIMCANSDTLPSFYEGFICRKENSKAFRKLNDEDYVQAWSSFFQKKGIDKEVFFKTITDENLKWTLGAFTIIPKDVINNQNYIDMCLYAKFCIKTTDDEALYLFFKMFLGGDMIHIDESIKLRLHDHPKCNQNTIGYEVKKYLEIPNQIIHFCGRDSGEEYYPYIDKLIKDLKPDYFTDCSTPAVKVIDKPKEIIPLKVEQTKLLKHFDPLRDEAPVMVTENDMRYCDWYYDHIVVLSDGRVTTCCADWDGANSMGNVYEQDIMDIWNGDNYKEFRRRNQVHGSCGASEKCYDCSHYMNKPKVDANFLRHAAPIKAPFPNTLQIEAFSVCNADCTECMFAKGRDINEYRGLKIMPWDHFTKIIDSTYLYLDFVRFYNYGEHWLHKQAFDMVKYIKDKREDIFIYTSTNFWYFDEEKLEKILNCGIDRIVVSLHGGSQKTAAGYMPEVPFDNVVNNMRRFVELRNAAGKEKPQIGWKSVIFPWNDSEEDMNRMRRLAKEIGVDRYGWELSGTASVSKRFQCGSPEHQKLIENDEIFGW